MTIVPWRDSTVNACLFHFEYWRRDWNEIP